MGKPNKPSHPWKRALSARKAAIDREKQKQLNSLPQKSKKS